MAKLLNAVSEAIQILVSNAPTDPNHVVRLQDLQSATGVAHTHTASQITDFSAASKSVISVFIASTQTIEFYSEGGFFKAKARRKAGGGILEDADGLYVEFPTGVEFSDLHQAASLGTLTALEGSIDAEQRISLSVKAGNGIVVDSTGVHADFGAGANQVARGNHTHAQLHDPVTVANTPGLNLYVSGQLISGVPVCDPNPPDGYAPLTTGSSGLAILLGLGPNQPKPGDWMPDEATDAAAGLLSAELHRKITRWTETLGADQVALFTRHDQLITGTYVGGIHRWGQTMQVLGLDLTAERYGSGGECVVGIEIDGVVEEEITVPDGPDNQEVTNSVEITGLFAPANVPVRIVRVSGTGNVETEPSRLNVSLRVRPGIEAAVDLRLNCGGSAVELFSDDAYFDLGTAGATSAAINLSGVTDPAPEEVYQTCRAKYGSASTLTYTIPGLSRGVDYNVRLHFAENYFTAAGQNVFTIKVIGATTVQTDAFDIYGVAGGVNRATVLEQAVKPDGDGRIMIQLSPENGSAGYNCSINGIELITLV